MSNLAYTDFTKNKIIVLQENDDDLYNNFIHELNHAVQNEYNLPSGYNKEQLTIIHHFYNIFMIILNLY